MDNYNVYQDIATRTNGDIYIGVVGPVRTGKSTFIKNFMDMLVLPNIDDVYKRERARDELPQSAGGKTIMTTEPKFIPNEAVEVSIDDHSKFKVRMIDCVGYIVSSALGHIENENPRMVKTPWSDSEIPFSLAAEIGTKKVIDEHSTIGLVITTDGSITEIPRDDYTEAEERVISELKEIKKPFIVVVNSTAPEGEQAQSVRDEIAGRYDVPVITCNCAALDTEDVNDILRTVLYEFPVTEVGFNIPDWILSLDDEHWLKKDFYKMIRENLKEVGLIRQIKPALSKMLEYDNIGQISVDNINLGVGTMVANIVPVESLFYNILKEESGFEVSSNDDIIRLMKKLSGVNREYEKIAYALHEVEVNGYGIVSPGIDDLVLEEPEIVRHGNRFGVRLKASAPSIHMIRADIETEVSPVVGSEKQSEDLVNYLMQEFEVNPKEIWDSNIFGKSLHELVNEDLHNKLYRMPEDAQMKLQETLQRIVNEGSGGLICIIL